VTGELHKTPPLSEYRHDGVNWTSVGALGKGMDTSLLGADGGLLPRALLAVTEQV